MKKAKLSVVNEFKVEKSTREFTARLLSISAEQFTAEFMNPRTQPLTRTASVRMLSTRFASLTFRLYATPAATLFPDIIGRTALVLSRKDLNVLSSLGALQSQTASAPTNL